MLSRATEARDRGRKMCVLAQFHVPQYWPVDPAAHTLAICVLRGSAYELAVAAGIRQTIVSPTLPDLSFAASRVFAE